MQPKPSLVRAHQLLTGVLVVLILVMATLAGRHLFLGNHVIEVHGGIGNFIFILTLANVALTLKTSKSGADFAVAVALVVLTFAQIGLGYVGRETLDAAAWHIPNGVLLMALSGYQFATVRARSIAGRTN